MGQPASSACGGDLSGSSPVRVLVEVQAGSTERTRYDENELRPIGVRQVSRPYPYSYGFVLGTTAADGDNVDCYVVGSQAPKSGQIASCEVVGLLEQVEAGEEDHKVRAVVVGETPVLPDGVGERLERFINAIFAEYPNSQVAVGATRSRDVALSYLQDHQDQPS